MHIYSKEQQAFHLGRTTGEKWLSRIFLLTIFVQILCFLMAIIRTARNTPSSMRNNFFFLSSLQLDISYTWPDCDWPVTESRSFFTSVNYTVNSDNVGYVVGRAVTNFRFLFGVTAGHLLVSSLNRLAVGMSIHEVRYHFVVFRKEMLLIWELLLTVLGIVLVFSQVGENKVLQNYVRFCGDRRANKFSDVVPLIELYVSFFFTIFVFLMNVIVAVIQQCKRSPQERLMAEEAEDEKIRQEIRQQQIEQRMSMQAQQGNIPLHQMEKSEGSPLTHWFGPSISRPQTPMTLGPENNEISFPQVQVPTYTEAEMPHIEMPHTSSALMGSHLRAPIIDSTEETVEIHSRA